VQLILSKILPNIVGVSYPWGNTICKCKLTIKN